MSDRIESRLKEDRRIQPGQAFVEHARVSAHHAYAALYRQSIEEPDEFWREHTGDLSWRAPWTKFSEWTLRPSTSSTAGAVSAKFFVGAKLNASESCLDRHLATARRNKAAIVWEGEPGDVISFTFRRRRMWSPR